jgi:phosphotransferase system enzyme I (PtsI)
MHPAHILTVKQQVLKAELPKISGIAQKMLKTHDPEKMHHLLVRLNQ